MSKWKVIWDGDSFIDGRDCESYGDAMADAEDTLVNWMAEQTYNYPYDLAEWTEKQIEDWDMMIYNCCSYVTEYDDDDNEIAEYYPEKIIGWCPYDELKEIMSN